MNTATTTQHGSGGGNGIAFLLGAIFNVISENDFSFLIEHTLQAFIGGFIFLLFKILGDLLTPFLEGPKEKIRRYVAKLKKKVE